MQKCVLSGVDKFAKGFGITAGVFTASIIFLPLFELLNEHMYRRWENKRNGDHATESQVQDDDNKEQEQQVVGNGL